MVKPGDLAGILGAYLQCATDSSEFTMHWRTVGGNDSEPEILDTR